MTLLELIISIDHLPTAEKWQLVQHILRSLEEEQKTAPRLEWPDFIKTTYGSLRDTLIQRAEQGEYEEWEPLAG
jgi:hypothetical protein